VDAQLELVLSERKAIMRFLFVFLTAVTLAAPVAAQSITQAELVRRTEEMYDAVSLGDSKPWDRYIADDVLYFDEKGRTMDKKALVDDVAPFPTGYNGSIKTANVKSLIFPTVAILTFDSIETETIFGQELHARYHETDTWLLRNGKWQIAAGQVLRYYEDPAAGSVDVARLDDYVGTYQLAVGQTIAISRDGDKLLALRSGGKPVRLLPESPDLFFRTGVEGRRLFRRNASGHVDTLIDRRNNEDIVWKKIK
jgi:hypothetical protein